MNQDVSRRWALRLGAAATGSALFGGSLVSRTAAASEPVDALVVGSGYAGSVAALRLAEAGIDSVVVERGRRWPITPDGDTFATPPVPDGRAAWLSTRSPFTEHTFAPFTGVLETCAHDGITTMAGAGVGGGSLVNYAAMMIPPGNLFRQSFGQALDYTEMAQHWYPRAQSLIGLSTVPDDVLNSSFYGNARQFARRADRAGLAMQRSEMAVDWDIVRAEIAGTTPRSAILGHAVWGINSGAKRSVDRTILARAERTGRTDVRPLHLVRDILPQGDRYLVGCEQLDEEGKVVGRPWFSSRRVFLAAGSLGTMRLLVRAKARGSLSRLNEAVGTGWGTSGDHLVAGTGLKFNNPDQGGPAHMHARTWDTSGAPVTLLSFPPLGLPALGMISSTMLAVSVVPGLGNFTYDPVSDEVKLSWPTSDPRVVRVSSAVRDTMRQWDSANFGLDLDVVTPALTAHSLGGAALGAATKETGELIGHPGLFVIDSSLIPGSTGAVPPALTVTALADRCVTLALQRSF
ncbi:GMC oxidoreductase [Haloactinomyces albus]|uniref:Cholesterol oxidase n=1 Tax=Haloactinomyces albus TaxID=1352928 RepID=A0AAE3ZEW7_9ACTN|nr:GMC oxidoreductase [Haloactinomyces albus]MDR7303678.1 cholesterol oxidase [Haloactinomyces albus]